MLAGSSKMMMQNRRVRSNIVFIILMTLLQSGFAIDNSGQRAQAASVTGVSFAPSPGSVSYFEENKGQTDDAVRYLSREHGYQLFLTASETVLALHTRDKQRPTPAQADVKHLAKKRVRNDKSFPSKMTVLRMRLEDVREDVTVTGEQKLRTKVNYYRGADPNKWQQDVPTYARVRQSDVYPGIDLVFSHTKGKVKYSFLIAPGADPAVIKMAFSGADKVRLNAKGELVLETQAGEFHHSTPRIYQIVNGAERPIPGGFALNECRISRHR
jgi:hypothetical protein